jgi:SAM-dependent methyltransferase
MLVQQIKPKHLKREIARMQGGWLEPQVPQRQWIEGAKPSLDMLAAGKTCDAFRVFRNLLLEARRAVSLPVYEVLDVGAASAYYRDVMCGVDFPNQYRACDISPAFAEFARKRLPGVVYDVCDARTLPYEDNAFDLVIEGAVLIHLADWDKVVAQCARVAKHFVMFHRTPIIPEANDEYWDCLTYDTHVLRVHLSRMRFEAAASRAGLTRVAMEPLGDVEGGAIMESSLWRKA